MGASMLSTGRRRAARVLSVIIALGIAGTAAAQPGRPSKEDLKPPPVLPKMAPPPTIAGVVNEANAENIWLLDLSDGGRVKIVLRPDAAPKTVERIKTLTREGFYDGTVFHRVIEGFMAQGGDPTGTGTGGSKLPDLKAEFNGLPHVRGAVAMARAGSPDSANSQFYIVLQPTLKLDGAYTVWGRVTDGMGYVDAIEKGEPPEHPSKIVKATLAADSGAAMTPVPAGVVPGVVAGTGAAATTVAGAPAVVAPAPASPPLSPAAADAARTGSVVGTVPMPPSASAPAASGTMAVAPAPPTPATAVPPK